MSTRFPQAELTEVPEDIAAKILEIQEKSGFVPNVFLMFARRPAEFRHSSHTTTRSCSRKIPHSPRVIEK